MVAMAPRRCAGCIAEKEERILLVDDEPDIRSLARDVLAPQGYRVLEAGNAEEALRVAREYDEPIDLLLTDVVMPGLHGHELAAQLQGQRPGLKVGVRAGSGSARNAADSSGPGARQPDPAQAIQRRSPPQEGERAARQAERASLPLRPPASGTR